MVKSLEMVKQFENAALDAVNCLLKRVSSIETATNGHDRHFASDSRLDARIDFGHGGIRHALLVKLKSNGEPRFARSAVHGLDSYMAHLHRSEHSNMDCQLVPMLVSSYLSPEARSICLDHDVAYLDLQGNAHLAFGNIYVERSVPGRPKSETRALRSLFTPKAGAILRVLLRDPARAWRVADLAEESNASLGHVSNVRKALLDREWAEIHEQGLVVIRPDSLLKSWRGNHRQAAGDHFSGYTIFHGDQLRNRLKSCLNPGPQSPRAICASNSAAQWLAPYVRGGTHSFYVDEPGAQAVKETLQLTHAAKGTNVILNIPKDETLFEDTVQPAPGIFCTDPVATYLDLWHGNDRDREAADHLAMKCFPWL